MHAVRPSDVSSILITLYN